MANEMNYGGLLNTFSVPVLIVDEDVRVKEFNTASHGLLGSNRSDILNKRAGDILQCLNSLAAEHGCASSHECNNCTIRNVVKECFHGSTFIQKKTTVSVKYGDIHVRHTLLITAYPLFEYDDLLALLIIEDMSKISSFQ